MLRYAQTVACAVRTTFVLERIRTTSVACYCHSERSEESLLKGGREMFCFAQHDMTATVIRIGI